jgi:aryl-alcohol dehydrogenase-like predicted oxidoreductase
VQPPYNLFEREIEQELLPYCRQSGLATFSIRALRRRCGARPIPTS